MSSADDGWGLRIVSTGANISLHGDKYVLPLHICYFPTASLWQITRGFPRVFEVHYKKPPATRRAFNALPANQKQTYAASTKSLLPGDMLIYGTV